VRTERLQKGLRTTVVGLTVNFGLAVGKLVAGWTGHSHALVADGVESLADLLSSVIVWRGLRIAAEPADQDHPYGHGKAEPLAAALVSLMLIFAAIWIAWTSTIEILRPHDSPAPFTLGVLLLVILIKETLFRWVWGKGNEMDSSAVRTDAWHHRSDAITSAAAFLGISIALTGGKGYESADNWAALVASCVIAFNGWRLLRPAFNELMDRAPDRELIEQIRAIAKTIPGVEEIDKCHVRKMGYQFFVDIHVVVDPQMTVERSHGIGHDVKDRLRTEIPAVRDVLVHIEPLKLPGKSRA
jgi:cation diffusion facilitator family transporter